MENYENIQKAFDKYTDTLKKIGERRKIWANETKQKIFETLSLVKDKSGFDWEIQKIDGLGLLQTVNFCMKKEYSGITDSIIDGQTGKTKEVNNYIKYGGYLAYQLHYNGKIGVVINFPYIEKFVARMDSEVIDSLEPEQITEELISKHIVAFLDKMAEWESRERTPIGFNY